MEARVQKARSYRKAPGASGRLHRTEAGDWVWSSDSEAEGGDDSDDDSDEKHKPSANLPGSKFCCRNIVRWITNLLCALAEYGSSLQNTPAIEANLSGSSTSSSLTSATSDPTETASIPVEAQADTAADSAVERIVQESAAWPAAVSEPINLVLRMRFVAF